MKPERQRVEIDAALLAAYDRIDRALGPAVALALQLNANGSAPTDAVRLEASLLDLAVRARDAMPNGGLLKIVTSDRQLHDDPDLADGAYAEITLIAEGTDRPAELPGGDLVRRAGGTLRVEKNSAGGLILRIFLAGAGEEPDPVLDEDGVSARRLRILLVENDPDRYLEMSLRELGHEIVAASDAATALAHLDGSFDLLVAVCAMLTTAGPARRQQPELRMLFVADNDEPGLEAIEHSAVLRLPFRKAELMQALAELDRR